MPRVAERTRVAAVVHVVADVPQAAVHRGEQAHGRNDHGEGGPARHAEYERRRGPGILENLGATGAMGMRQPHDRPRAAEVDGAERHQLIDLRSTRCARADHGLKS